MGYKWVGLKDGDPWTATLISKKGDVETWKGNDGCEWSWFGTFSPSLKWSSCTGADGKQEITPLKGKIWPMVVGNTFEYGYSGPTWMGTRKCTVKAQVWVKTGTGEHDTFKIVCKDNVSVKTWYRSPKLGITVIYIQDHNTRGTNTYELVRQEFPGSPSTGQVDQSKPTPTATSPAVKTPQRQGGGTIEERLAKLKELLDKGLLTPDEAAEKRKEILNSL